MLGQPVRNMMTLEVAAWLLAIPAALVLRWMGYTTMPWPVFVVLMVAAALAIHKWRTGRW